MGAETGSYWSRSVISCISLSCVWLWGLFGISHTDSWFVESPVGSREVSLPKRRFRACCGSRVDSLPHTQITVVEFALAIVVCCDYGSREVSLPGVVSSADEIELWGCKSVFESGILVENSWVLRYRSRSDLPISIDWRDCEVIVFSRFRKWISRICVDFGG